MQINITQNPATASQYTHADDALGHADVINDSSEDFYAVLRWIEDDTGQYFVIRVYDYLVERYIGLAR